EGMNKIPELRKSLEQVMKSAEISDATNYIWIGGETATLYDTKQTTERDQNVIIPVMIGSIALLLLVYLRSVVAMIYLIVTVVLSFLSALGAGWLLLHYGMDAPSIQGAIPLYAFVFLVALGEDYNIFMVSEIWKNKRSQPHLEAVKNGVVQTGSVITSAGLILAGTFAVLATLPIQVLVQFGIVTAIGVLLDTFIVRPLLVPAITVVLGRFVFWPGKLWKKKERTTADA
ncbi:MMPL family transporter, partial [Bacillus pseudomycoides]